MPEPTSGLWLLVVLWLVNSDPLPTVTGTGLVANEVFRTLPACIARIPHYDEIVRRQFVSPGPVVCWPTALALTPTRETR